MGTLSVFLIFVVLLILSSSSEISCFSNYNNCTCKQHERKALLDFKHSLSFDPYFELAPAYHPLSSWVGEDCCRNWVGVLCDEVTCNVVSLVIEESEDTIRSKVFSPALFELKHLETLLLSGIDSSGSRVPQSIGSLKNLTELQLSYSNFSGPIPQQLNNLTNLFFLDLEYSFQGTKVDNLNWISNLQNTIFLHLSGTDLSQTPYDSLRILHQSPSLQSLFFTDCKLSGIHFSQFLSNSSFLSMSSISKLDFSNNNLDGPIPYTLTNISTLTDLHLSNNSLSGVIHEAVFANLPNLNILSLGSNSLVLESSHHIAGNPSFPKWLLSKNFTDLDLSYCSISLPLPPVYDIGSSLHSLNISNNKINGSLWRLPSSLKSLNLANNDIGGQIPKSICNCSLLELLSLQNNTISGTIPSCLNNVINLKVLDLSSNALSGIIPRSLGTIFGLYVLNLSNNSLQGELPKFNTSTTLEVMDLSENRLSGIIPQWTRENLGRLWLLRLRSNNIFGSIPSQICSLNESLQILDLADNHLMGVIPQCIGNLGAMKNPSVISTYHTIQFYGTSMSIEETIKGLVLRYGGNLQRLVSLDLSCNNIVGPIPPNLTSLQGLKNLNLSHNQFIGSIPSKIGQLRSLESLDLSNNCLSRSIPLNMSALYSLEVLHL